MSSANAHAPAAPEPDLIGELKAQPYEPLLPVEKGLIAGSLLLGVVLLGVLLWVSSTLFPVPERQAAGTAAAPAGSPR